MSEIDLSKYKIRTDLAIDEVENIEDKGYILDEYESGGVKVTKVKVDEKGSKVISKKPGTYITVEAKDLSDHDNVFDVEKILANEIRNLIELEGLNENSTCMAVGLGNDESTPDALGPKVISNIIVTKHIFELQPESIQEGFREVSAIRPGVMGQTGIETGDIIYSIVKKVNPDFLIVVDALASSSIERLTNTIQMTNTGIHPGSGVGNKRKEISKDNLGIPVIAIGVPTVCDAVSITSDTIDYIVKHFTYHTKNYNKPSNKLKPTIMDKGALSIKDEDIEHEEKTKYIGMLGHLDNNEKRQLIKEVLTPIGYNLIVTPKSIDFSIEEISNVISRGIDLALHESVE